VLRTELVLERLAKDLPFVNRRESRDRRADCNDNLQPAVSLLSAIDSASICMPKLLAAMLTGEDTIISAMISGLRFMT